MKYLFITIPLLYNVAVNSLPVDTDTIATNKAFPNVNSEPKPLFVDIIGTTSDKSLPVTNDNQASPINSSNEVASGIDSDQKSVDSKWFNPFSSYSDYSGYGGYGGYNGYPTYGGYYPYPYPYPYPYQKNPSVLGSLIGPGGVVQSILGTGK
ncbi:hypothetical protein K502DRAFT_354311 [Neoconidiobolus thromboides FSU 785]|nr:hypothetical protein K502DRAFT_354311 [Neoconidiobolus thromboides FSU 785]